MASKTSDAPKDLSTLAGLQTVSILDRQPRITLGELAYTKLRDAILTTQIKPGTPVSENDLSAVVGVSRTPIREAIRRLAEDRLVDVSPSQGTFVSRINRQRAVQAIFVRRTIECGAMRAKGVFSDQEIQSLERNLAQHKQALDERHLIRAATLDDAFHAALMDVCGYPEATVATRAISGDITRILFLSGADEHYFASVASDHQRLLDHLRHGDLERAVTLLDRHIDGFSVDQDRLQVQASEFFE
jgi:DNA-binding GntR family transcriptional regulator